MEMFSLGKSEKIFQIKKFLQYNCLFFRIICSELLRTFTKETFLFEIFFHFSPIKTFPFGLILMGHISVFQVNDSKSMNFFYNFRIFCISCEQTDQFKYITKNGHGYYSKENSIKIRQFHLENKHDKVSYQESKNRSLFNILYVM